MRRLILAALGWIHIFSATFQRFKVRFPTGRRSITISIMTGAHLSTTTTHMSSRPTTRARRDDHEKFILQRRHQPRQSTEVAHTPHLLFVGRQALVDLGE